MRTLHLLVLGFIVGAPASWAKRSIEIFQHSATVLDKTGTSRVAAVKVTFNCVNLSAIKQSVSVTAYDQELSMSICVERPDSTVSSRWSIAPTCFGNKKHTPADRTVNLTLNPNAAGDFNVSAGCVFMRGGPICDGSGDPANFDFGTAFSGASVRAQCTSYTPYEFANPRTEVLIDNCLRAASAEFKAKFRLEVAEDRGSVLCGGYINPSLPWGPSNEIQAAIVQVNGGRPF